MADPAPLYYLDNYRQLLSWVGERYRDLLEDAEQQYATQFLALPLASQALLVRMITRKGEIFRIAKLAYDEIGSSEAALSGIPPAWIDRDPMLSAADLFRLFTKSELQKILQNLPAPESDSGSYAQENLTTPRAGATKAEWQAAVAAGYPEPMKWSQWHALLQVAANESAIAFAHPDALVAIKVMPWSNTYQWLFFGNRHQSLAEFVLSELGVFRYEAVAFNHQSRSFESRRELDFYQQLAEIAEAFDEGHPPDRLLKQLLALARPAGLHLARRYDRLAYKLAYRLEQLAQLETLARSGQWALVLAGYNKTQLPESRPRIVRVLEKQQQFAAAYEQLQLALADPLNEAERQQLERMQPRLARKLGEPPLAKTTVKLAPNWRTLSRELAPEGPRVEQLVADALCAQGEQALWSENWLWTSLFGIALWPAIYAPVPGAFFHPFQSAPKDINLPGFYQRRKAQCDQCLSALSAPDCEAQWVARLKEKQGIQSHFVHWQLFDEACLRRAFRAIGPNVLRAVFERMLFDLPANRAGFPDLIVLGSKPNNFRLIEVKGPGDTLQENQKRWLHFFNAQGVDASVLHVTWRDAGKTTGPAQAPGGSND